MAGSEKKTVHEHLVEIQQELKVPKDQWNDFSKFNYRSAEAILEKVKPLCHSRGLTIKCTDEVIHVGERHYVKATAILSDGQNSEQASASAREQESKKGMTEDQITGSASSYARKYALGGLFGIDDTKDADSHDNRQQGSKQPAATKPKTTGLATDKQRQLIQQKLADQGISQENTKGYLIEQFGVEIPLTKEGASFVIEELIGGANV